MSFGNASNREGPAGSHGREVLPGTDPAAAKAFALMHGCVRPRMNLAGKP